MIVGNRAGIGAPKPATPSSNPLQFISGHGTNQMAHKAKETLDKMKEQKEQGKQKLEQLEDTDWQHVCKGGRRRDV